MSAVTRLPGGARGRGRAGWAKDGSPAGIVTRFYASRDRADLPVMSLRTGGPTLPLRGTGLCADGNERDYSARSTKRLKLTLESPRVCPRRSARTRL
jgi:hypothetical protein